MLKHSGRELKKLLAIVKKNYPECDSTLIQRAFSFAKKAHRNQKRESKQPFFIHPVAAAFILAELGADCKTVAAALLHDVLEDTKTKPAQLKGLFGQDVLRLVQGVTKLTKIAEQKQSVRAAANLQHLLLATTKEPRVIVIKLADKLHNLRTLRFLPSEDRHRIAAEALAVYAPIALKLGIHALYNEMSGLAFKFLRPDVYRVLKRSVVKKEKAKRPEINAMIGIIKKKVGRDFLFSIDEKTFFAIYSKMQAKEKSLDEVPDTLVLKIIAPTVADCYCLLGILHGLFTPLPGKIKDYIALPQPNLYQALHSTVLGPSGNPVKVRIATKEMQEITSKGIIAFWQLQSKGTDKLLSKNIALLAKVMGKSAAAGSSDFVDALKSDFLAKTMTVFSAAGKAVELPAGATPIDFAFNFDKKSAFRLWEAKVNGKFVSLSRKLESGDIVELIPSSELQVKESWIHFAKSFAVKEAIRVFLRKQQRNLLKQMPSIDLNVKANDAVGVLAAISRAISGSGINIKAADVAAMPNTKAECHFNLEFPSAEKLRKAIEKIKKIKDVKLVEIIYRE